MSVYGPDINHLLTYLLTCVDVNCMLMVSCTVPRLTQTLPMPDVIQGVTQLFDELFILHARDAEQVEVYTTAGDYMRVRCLTIPELGKLGVCDITSCEQNRCVYLSNTDKDSIHVVVLKGASGKFSKWTLSETPCGLSVTETGSLLVTAIRTRRLLEFNPRGNCIRTVKLHAELENPYHSIRLASGNFVLCCVGGLDRLHRVCIVNPEGKVEQSYGSSSGGGEGQLNYPTHIAVDKDEFVFVADRDNARIVLLNPSLQFVCFVLPNELLLRTNHVYINHASNRLYTSSRVFHPLQGRSDVNVVQL